ncbi:hypothetical protein FI667_g11999, partial [Globisporangium splendens]
MHIGATSTMLNDHRDQERAGKTTPRIKTGNCSISTATSTANALSAAAAGATDSAIYDKQMAWKLHGQRKAMGAQMCTYGAEQLQSKCQELSNVEDHECTFSPKVLSDTLADTNTSKRKSIGSGKGGDHVASQVETSSLGGRSNVDADADRADDEDGAPSTTTARVAAVHPAESQESSIQLHLVRQEPPQPIAEPLERRKATKTITRALSSSSASSASQQHSSNNNSSNNTNAQQQQPPIETKEDTWDKYANVIGNLDPFVCIACNSPLRCTNLYPAMHFSFPCRERSSLISIIDAQRRELELREKAQHEALRVAENFATAIQAFEERLLVVEQSTLQELAGIRELLQRQLAATDLILQSLGITQPPLPSSSSLLSASSSSPSSSATQSLARRETK